MTQSSELKKKWEDQDPGHHLESRADVHHRVQNNIQKRVGIEHPNENHQNIGIGRLAHPIRHLIVTNRNHHHQNIRVNEGNMIQNHHRRIETDDIGARQVRLHTVREVAAVAVAVAVADHIVHHQHQEINRRQATWIKFDQ